MLSRHSPLRLPAASGPALRPGARLRRASPRAWAVAVRRGLVWLLIGALCVYACSGAMLRMLGPTHWHATLAGTTHGAATATPAAAGALADWLAPPLQRVRGLLAGIRAIGDRAHAGAHALGIAAHQHSHSQLLRHWHRADDDSVRSVAGDAANPELADLKAAAAMGGATLLPAPGPALGWQVQAQANGAWPAKPAPPWRSADTAPPVEPPIA